METIKRKPGRPRVLKPEVQEVKVASVELPTPVEPEVVKTPIRPVEVIKEELAKAKTELKTSTKVIDDISIGKDLDAEIDFSSVPKEIKEAYPDMNFHWSRVDTRDMTKKLVARYQVVHIPESCKDLLAVYKSRPRSRLTDAYGDDTMTRGDELILMMCPKPHYDRRKQKLIELQKSRLDGDANKDIAGLRKTLGKDIKSASISINK